MGIFQQLNREQGTHRDPGDARPEVARHARRVINVRDWPGGDDSWCPSHWKSPFAFPERVAA